MARHYGVLTFTRGEWRAFFALAKASKIDPSRREAAFRPGDRVTGIWCK